MPRPLRGTGLCPGSNPQQSRQQMVEVKREVNDLLSFVGKEPKYGAPARVDAFLAGGEQPSRM